MTYFATEWKEPQSRHKASIIRLHLISEAATRGSRPATLLKKGRLHRCFPVTFAKFLRTPFTKHVWATASLIWHINLAYKLHVVFYSQKRNPYW